MPENRQVQSNGGVSNSPVDNIEDALWRLKIQNNGNKSYPDRPGEPDCIYDLRTGFCGYGDNCRYNHPSYIGQGGEYRGELPERFGEPECAFFLKTGTCKYGSACKFHHPREITRAGTVPLNSLGLPMRQDEKPCSYYMRNGICKFGAVCKFHHPQPTSAEAVLPPPVATACGPLGSSILPLSSLSYVGGFPAWSLPRVPYLSSPSLQAPQNYMPVALSPSHSIAPAQGWSTYLGSMSPVSSTIVCGANPVYNSTKQGVSSSSKQLQMISTSTPLLPERPDQPQCWDFMNKGSCTYGYDCKYHHPRERIIQVATNSLGPHGLPLRPGQAICSQYRILGLCQYGPNCKFDHPLAVYSCNYSLILPSVYMLDPSLFPYQ